MRGPGSRRCSGRSTSKSNTSTSSSGSHSLPLLSYLVLSALLLLLVGPQRAAGEPYSGSPILIPGEFSLSAFDSGANGTAYLSIDKASKAPNADDILRDGSDVYLDPYVQSVTAIAEGEWLSYTVDIAAGTYAVAYLLSVEAGSPADGALHLVLGPSDCTLGVSGPGTAVGGRVQNVGGAGDAQQAVYQVVKGDPLVVPADMEGVDLLTVCFDSGTGDDDFRVLYISLHPASELSSDSFNPDCGTVGSGGAGARPFNGEVPELPTLLMARDFDYGGQGVSYNSDLGGDPVRYQGRSCVDVNIKNGYVQGLTQGDWFTYTVRVTEAATYEVQYLVSGQGVPDSPLAVYLVKNTNDCDSAERWAGASIVDMGTGLEVRTLKASTGIPLSPSDSSLTVCVASTAAANFLAVDLLANLPYVGYGSLAPDCHVEENWLLAYRARPPSGVLPISDMLPVLPAFVLARDFDHGPLGVAYSSSAATHDRPCVSADVRDGNLAGLSSGDWFRYSIAATPGTYSVILYASSSAPEALKLRVVVGDDCSANGTSLVVSLDLVDFETGDASILDALTMDGELILSDQDRDISLCVDESSGSTSILGFDVLPSAKVVEDAINPTVAPVPTFAPTAAPTPVPAATFAPTEAPTPAPAATEAPTPAPTTTEAPTPAPTTTEAPTPAPTATEAPTPAPTATEAPTPAPTATEAPTPAPTATEAPTPAPAATEAPTPAPTATEAPTPAPTPAPAAVLPTPAPVRTPAPSFDGETPSPTPMPTAEPTPAPLRTPAPSFGGETPSPTPTPTIEPTPAPVRTPAPSSGGETPSPTPTPSKEPTTPAPTGTPAPSPGPPPLTFSQPYVTKLLGESVATFTPIKQEAFLAAVTDVSDLLTRDLTTASPDDKIGVDGEARRLLLQQRILQGTQSSPAVLALYTVFQATEKELQEGVSNLDLAHTSGSLLDAYRLELAARGVPPEDDLTTSTINETNPVDPDGGGTSSTGAIIGGVVAGVAAAGLLAFAAFRKCGSKPLMPCCSAPDEEEDGYYNGISGVKTGPYSVKPEEASAPHLSRNSFSLASAPIGPRFSNDLSAAAEVQQMTESGYGSTARILLDYVGSDGLASSWHATRAAIAEPSPLVDPAHLLLGGIICQFQGYDLSLTAKNFPEIRKWCLSYQAILVTLDQKVKELSTVDEEGDLVSALELAPSQSDLEGGQSTGSVSSVAVADGDASAVKSTGGHSAAVSVTRGTTSSDAGALIDDGSGNMALSADQESGRLVEVEDSLYFILRNCGSHTRRRMLPQFAVSRRCQCLLDDASASLRVCLLRMDMGADEELLSMLSAMESIELNIDDNVTVLLGAMKINSEEQDMEVQLAELGRALRQMGDGATDQGQEPPAGDNATLDTVLFCSDGRSMPEAEPANHMSKNLPDYEDIEATLARLQVSPDSIQRVRPHPLGKGAFSEVYLVRHEGELRAAKCVEISDFNARQLQQVYLRFAKEIYVLSKLSHNHIISIRGAVATTDQLCILLDYMSRGSVRQMLDDDHTGGEFSQKYGTNIVLQMAQGLQYLHSQGVLHRDLKSANVLVDEDWSIRIADFGMSRTSSIVSSYAGSTASVASFRGGTLAWSPPELFGHPPKHGSKSDVWSFGVVAWEILCGGTSPPWSWLELPAMMVTLSEGQALPVPSSLHLREEHRALMNACWTRDPQLRPNFDQIVETLEAMRPSSTADDDLVLIPRRE